MTTIRIAVLFTNFGPYHLARIKALNKWCSHIGWEVIGIELARSEQEYAWRIELEQLSFPIISVTLNQLEQVRLEQIVGSLYKVLSKINPDVLAIAGYGRPAMLATLLWGIWKRKPTILFSATHEHDAKRFAWTEILKSLIIKPYRAALVGGKKQKQYLIKLGMAADSIFLGYNTVDNEKFHPNKLKALPCPVNQPYFLAINRFVPKKNLSFLLHAYAKYRQLAGTYAWDLVICGDGSMRVELENQIINLNLDEIVHLPGFLQQDELLPYFTHASCFIHASTHEQWGLVVNEAMAAGLPVLVSNRCGCFEDLVVEGINGFGFDPNNNQQLTNLMIKVSSGEIDLEHMSQAALEHIQKFSPDYFAQGLIQAVEYAVTH